MRYVALPDVDLDGSAVQEAALIRGGLPGLRPVFRDNHWRVFRVRDATPLATGAGRLTRLRTQGFDLRATGPGTIVTKIRWTPYWRVSGPPGACVQRTPEDLTAVRVPRPGPVRVDVAFGVGRIGAKSPRC